MIAVRCIAPLATFAFLTVSTAGAASDELARAKDLYRTAAYDEALVALEEIAGESSGDIRTEANEYRLFCLIALDRKLDARVIIESMVNADPFYQMSTTQASPRVRAMFNDIRQTMLPGIWVMPGSWPTRRGPPACPNGCRSPRTPDRGTDDKRWPPMTLKPIASSSRGAVRRVATPPWRMRGC